MTVARSIQEEGTDQLKKDFVCHFVELVYFHLQSVKHLIFEETVLAPWLKALKKRASCYSVAKSCPALCNPMYCSMPGFPVLNHPLEFAQFISTEFVTLSHHLILNIFFLSLIFPASGSFPLSQLFTSDGQVLELKLQHQPFQ